MSVYRCSACGVEKPAHAFHRRHDGRTRPVHHHCKACRVQRDHARHAVYRDYLNAEKARRGACLDCGEMYHPWQMDFDHRPGEQKRFELSEGGSRSLPELHAEMAKCDLICANCHRTRTHVRQQYVRRTESQKLAE